jgi:hypothetical protein
VKNMPPSQKLQQLRWLLLIWLASVAAMATAAAALKLVMRFVGLAG